MEFLCSPEVRKESDVAVNYIYVFPSIKGSDNHVSGWHALMACCKKAKLDGKITGTMNRHRVSSLIGALAVPEHLITAEMSIGIYAKCPQAERQLEATGKYLHIIDKGLASAIASNAKKT